MHSALRCAAGATDRYFRAGTDFFYWFDVNFYRRLHRYTVYGKFSTNAFMPYGIRIFLPSIGNFEKLEQLGVDSSYADKQSENSKIETEIRLPGFLA